MTTQPKPETAPPPTPPTPPVPPSTPSDVDADAAGTSRPGAVQRWLDALRDGDYAQGYFYLMQNDVDAGTVNAERQFCCLGVACDISALGDWDADDDVPKHCYLVAADVDALDALDGGAPGTIPERVRAWLGLRTPLGEFYATAEWLDALWDVDANAADKVMMHLSELRTDGKLDDDVDGDGAPVTLAGLNDAAGLTFSEIANVVDTNPDGLFE